MDNDGEHVVAGLSNEMVFRINYKTNVSGLLYNQDGLITDIDVNSSVIITSTLSNKKPIMLINGDIKVGSSGSEITVFDKFGKKKHTGLLHQEV